MPVKRKATDEQSLPQTILVRAAKRGRRKRFAAPFVTLDDGRRVPNVVGGGLLARSLSSRYTLNPKERQAHRLRFRTPEDTKFKWVIPVAALTAAVGMPIGANLDDMITTRPLGVAPSSATIAASVGGAILAYYLDRRDIAAPLATLGTGLVYGRFIRAKRKSTT